MNEKRNWFWFIIAEFLFAVDKVLRMDAVFHAAQSASYKAWPESDD